MVIALVGSGKAEHGDVWRPWQREERHDLLLSTLRAYLEAIGGHVRIVVTFQGGG